MSRDTDLIRDELITIRAVANNATISTTARLSILNAAGAILALADSIDLRPSTCAACPHCNPCKCREHCTDTDPDGEGVCRSLPPIPGAPT